MASVQPLVHIDFTVRSTQTQQSDFSDVALQPGRAVLEDTNANCYVLMRWLGPLVAESDRHGGRIDFYLRDERNSRVPNVFCSVVTDADLDGDLQADFDRILSLLKAATPKNNSEQHLLAYAVQELTALKSDARKQDRRFYFMKWQDSTKKWHLIWIPGFARSDAQPAVPVICTSKCKLYFLNRTNATPRCPECHGESIRIDQHQVSKRRTPWGLIAALVLLAALVGSGLWSSRLTTPQTVTQQALLIAPAPWKGPVGSQVTFTVRHPGTKSQPDQDASLAAHPVVDDSRIMAFDEFGLVAHAKSPGTTRITFAVGDRKQHVEVTVEPPTNPQELILEPDRLEVPVDAQVAWTLKGKYHDGRMVDLTSAAVCPTQSDSPFLAGRGIVRGLEAGEGELQVGYRATPDSEFLSTTIPVTVVERTFKSLEMTVTPSTLPVGKVGEISVTAMADDGTRHLVTSSEKLDLQVGSESNAVIEGHRLRGLSPGVARLSAKFRGLNSDLDVLIEDAGTMPLAVHPQSLTLRVGEIADLQISAAPNPPVRILSSIPSEVQVSGQSRLIGRAIGSGDVQVVQGATSVAVRVTVVAADFSALMIDPALVSVPVDDSRPLRVMAEFPTGSRAEIAPDQLHWLTLPPPDIAQLDRQSLRIQGIQQSLEPGDLEVRFGELIAVGRVEVTYAPVRLELTPAGTVELPVGQTLGLKLLACYGDGRNVAIPSDKVEWDVESIEGLRFGAGIVEAIQAGTGPLKLRAHYQGQSSNTITVSSIEAEDLTLQLVADKSTLSVGDTGNLTLTGNGRHGPVNISLDGVVYETSAADILAVNAESGAFRGHAPGKAVFSARHPLFSKAGSCEVEVVAGTVGNHPVRLVTNSTSPISLPTGVIFSDFRVESTDSAGQVHDVTTDAILSLEGNPDPTPVVFQPGRIATRVAGIARVKASYQGTTANETLEIHVTDKLDIDAVTVTPHSLELGKGDKAGVRAVGWKKSRIVGDITHRPDVTWKSSSGSVINHNGHITGRTTGRSHVTAHVGGFQSQPTDVTVSSRTLSSRRLVVTPASLTMGLDESLQIGTDILITRDGADVSDQCRVFTTTPSIVAYRPERNSLVARGAGHARVTFVVGMDSVSMKIRVDRERRANQGVVRLVVEPAQLDLAVGQEAPVRVFRVSENGQRSDVTDSALLSSSADSVVAITRRGVLGLAAGNADITARLSGVDTIATANAIVTDVRYSNIEITPNPVALSVGERHSLTIAGVTRNGNVRLGPHPDLKLSVGGTVPDAVRIEQEYTLFGAAPGSATLNIHWRNQPVVQIPVVVTINPLRDLMIQPSQSTIGVGDVIAYQVFARRGGALIALDENAGVTLHVGNQAIATTDGGLRIRGKSRGVTDIVARLGEQRARADLTVTSASSLSGSTSTAEFSTWSSSGHTTAPAAHPMGLEFLPTSMRIELGSPGSNIRVVRLLADGRQEDVNRFAKFTVREPQDVISISNGPTGPRIIPRKIGQTNIDAELDGLRARTPLLVDVVGRLPGFASIRVVPDPLVIHAGQSGSLARVEVIPSTGGTAIELPFKLSAPPSPIFRVETDSRIVATGPGQATATVTILDPMGKYDGLTGSATIVVPDSTPPEGARLQLTGPTETTVGAEIGFIAELQSSGRTIDVTNTETTLIVPRDQSDIAELLPGCRLVARKPGRLTLQARYRDQISSSRTLIIRPVSEFARLELEFDSTPMHVGESRSYKIWGHPRSGGTRQDVTPSGSAKPTPTAVPQLTLTVTRPAPESAIVTHTAPTIVARQSGQFQLHATLGSLLTPSITVDVSDAEAIASQLKVEPSTITMRIGEVSPPLRAFARSRGDLNDRMIEAHWESLDETVAILKPDAPAGRIQAMGFGQTQVRAQFGGLTALVDIKVVGDRFRRVSDGKLVNLGKQTFSIELEIEGDRSESELEYRLVCTDQAASDWIKAKLTTNGMLATVTSPPLKFGSPLELHQLRIEARDTRDKSVEQYPYSFRIVAGVTRVNQQP